MTLEEKIEQIKNNKIDCNTFPLSRFSHFTMQEQIKCFYEKIIEVIEISNESLDLLKFLVEIGISEEIAKKIEIMIVDGTFDSIINSSELIHEKVLNKIDNMVTEGVFDTIINENIFNELNTTILNTLKKVDDIETYDIKNINRHLTTIDNKNESQDGYIDMLQDKTKYNLNRIKSNEIVIKGLLNENDDKRLTIEGEGNSLKLEGSKKGLVTVDKVVGDTLVNIGNNIFTRVSDTLYRMDIFGLIKPNATYSVLSNLNSTKYQYALYKDGATPIKDYSSTSSLTTFNYDTNDLRIYVRKRNDYTGEDNTFNIYEVKNSIVVLDGDYTNKPIPSEYFEGMQSTFENQLVTQEMVDSGEEQAENLGKYKCLAKVRGKNLIDFQPNYGGGYSLNHLTNGTKYRFISKEEMIINISDTNETNILVPTTTTKSIDFVYNDKFNYSLKIWTSKWGTVQNIDGIGLYDLSCERTQTVYLNSPLLKGDEIVAKEDGLYHYHKMFEYLYDGSNDENWSVLSNRFWINNNNIKVGGFVMCDKYATDTYRNLFYNSNNCIAIHDKNKQINIKDMNYSTVESFKDNLKNNNIKIVGELKEPYFEKISDDKLLLEIPNNATLSVESVIPCTSISASYTGGIPSVYGLEETNKNQDNLIDISLCATDEMYMMLEPILEMMPTTMNINERMVSKMVDMYVAMVIRGLKTIEEVPARYREEVKRIVDELKK